MCGVGIGLAIGATLFSAYSQYQSASAEAKALKANASNNQKIAEYNAQVSEVNAENQDNAAKDAMARGAEESARVRDNYRRANARARTIAAGRGLLVDSGTIGDIQDQNVQFGELDALTTMNNYEREAYGYTVRASDFRNQATNQRFQGAVGVNNAQYQASVTRNNGLLTSASTLVTGGANAYRQYNAMPTKITSKGPLPWQAPGNVNPQGGFY